MTDARQETPDNLNFLSPHNFKFVIRKTPHLNFFLQTVNIPGISIQNTGQPNPFVEIPYSGEHIQYDDIMCNFKVDENLENYLEIHNWIKKLGFPKTYDEYKSLSDLDQNTGLGLKSDMTLMILSSDRNPKFEVIFRDAFPVSLSSIIFDITMPDIQYLEAACTFRYTYYDILPIGSNIEAF